MSKSLTYWISRSTDSALSRSSRLCSSSPWSSSSSMSSSALLRSRYLQFTKYKGQLAPTVALEPPPLSLIMSLSQCPSPPQVAVANPILHPQHPIYLCRSYHDLSGSLSYSRLAVQYQFSLRDRDSYCHEFNMDMFSQPHPSSARFPDMHLWTSKIAGPIRRVQISHFINTFISEQFW